MPTEDNGILVSNSGSSEHAELWATKEGVVLFQDMISGTWVNGVQVTRSNKPFVLSEGDVLELGVNGGVGEKIVALVECAGFPSET